MRAGEYRFEKGRIESISDDASIHMKSGSFDCGYSLAGVMHSPTET